MNKKYLFFILSIALYSLVLWGFPIRLPVPPAYHFLYPLMFLLLFTLQCVFAYTLMKRSRFISGYQPLSMLLFISISIFITYSISSIKRESEIRNYFAKNENALNHLAKYYIQYGDDDSVSKMKQAMKIERLWCKQDIFQAKLYTCLGYGYGVLYAEEANMERPDKLGAIPIKNWLKLKEHWYYYSTFD